MGRAKNRELNDSGMRTSHTGSNVSCGSTPSLSSTPKTLADYAGNSVQGWRQPRLVVPISDVGMMMMFDGVIHFGVLGTLDVVRDGRSVAIPAAKQRIIMATLLLDANEFVARERLVDRLWNGNVPRDPRSALHSHVSRLRRVLGDKGRLIRAHGDGYAVSVAGDGLDLLRFRDLTARAVGASDAAAEVELLGRALALWRGPALVDVPSELLHHDDVPGLAEERLLAMERLLHLRLRLGRHEETVAPLKALTAEYPFRERLWAHLMAALFLSGRRAEALEVYRSVASLLREELGIDPGQELTRLHIAILGDDVESVRLFDEAHPAQAHAIGPPGGGQVGQPGGTLVGPRGSRVGPLVPGPLVPAAGERLAGEVFAPVVFPRQLPSDVAHFTGRVEQLRELDGLLVDGAGVGGSMPIAIAAVTGMGGVGKSAVAVHWAHRVIDRFPDGVLYLNLRGFGPGSAVEPDVALEMLLRSLGVPAARVPKQTDGRSAMLRSVLGRRRVLLVLDNARDAAQVRPLLPGSRAFVLVTSRDQLRGLVAREGAHRIGLGPLSSGESTALLSMVVGPARVEGQPEAAAELARLCGYLPLALMIAAEHATVGATSCLGCLVRKMLQARNRLDLLDTVDDREASLRAVLSCSYRVLPSAAGRLLRLLSLHPGSAFDAPAVAALAGLGRDQARRLLDQLADRSLLERAGREQYRFHDLIHAYASELVLEEDSQGERVSARRRVLDYYLDTAAQAADQLEPSRRRFPSASIGRPVEPLTFDGPAAAMRWLREQRANLRAAVGCAAEHGWEDLTWQLPQLLWRFFFISGHPRDWIDTHASQLSHDVGEAVLGVDTHKDVHVAAVVSAVGVLLGSQEFPASEAGYQQLSSWARSFGQVIRAGVEGTGSYGAALTRHLQGQGLTVIEVNRPDRQMRRSRGKSDATDAHAAAMAVLSGRATAIPKAGDGQVEQMRIYKVAKDSAVKSRTQAINQLKMLLVNAEPWLRAPLTGLTSVTLVARCAELRPEDHSGTVAASMHTLRLLAHRIQHLNGEIRDLERRITDAIKVVAPDLLEEIGVGADSAAILLIAAGDNPGRLRDEASFAALCGVSPVEASSGKSRCRRLNRGGDRQANAALFRVILTRMRCDERTRDYVVRRTADGLSKREIMRCLKRYLARSLFRIIRPAISAHNAPAAP
ncbi:IS110 family transposase [Nonomuraea sp. NPDC003707]